MGRKQVNEGHTMGIVETRAYKSAPSGSTSRSSEARVEVVSVGELDEDAIKRAGVGWVARKGRK